MAVLDNTIKAEDSVPIQDELFVGNFDREVDRLAEVLGIIGVEQVRAGQSWHLYKITGQPNAAEVEEGDEVPLSKYQVETVAIHEFDAHPYRKLTTAQSVLRNGYENAVLKTDNQMISDLRNLALKKLFDWLKGTVTDIHEGEGVKTATGQGLQGAFAYMDQVLGDALEDKGRDTDPSTYVWFVNRKDVADYLAKGQVSTQTAFGMTYLTDFLGATGTIFLTNKVEAGTAYVTPAQNLHIFGVDFSELNKAGMPYVGSDNNLIGVCHEAALDRASCVTNVMTGMTILPEYVDFIVKGTITPFE